MRIGLAVVFTLISMLVLPMLRESASALTGVSATLISMSGSCNSPTLGIELNATPNNNDGGGFDHASFVLFDGDGTPFAFYNAPSTTGGPQSLTANFPFTSEATPDFRPFTFRIYDTTAPSTSVATALAGVIVQEISFDPASLGFCSSLPIYSLPVGSTTSSVIPFRYDGRLCYWDQYAVYTTGEKIDIYGINGSRGFPVLNVTQDELDAVPGADGVNTLVKATEDGLVQVYRLGTSNVYEVHAGLDFVRFTDLPAGNRVCGTVDLD